MLTGMKLVSELAKLSVTMKMNPPRREQRSSGRHGDDNIWDDYVLTYRDVVETVSVQQAMQPHAMHTLILDRARQLVRSQGGPDGIPAFE